MSRKRRNTSSPELSDKDTPAPKRQQVSFDAGGVDEYENVYTNERSQIDPNFGMSGAFPGLANDVQDEFYGPALDGIDYLHMVR